MKNTLVYTGIELTLFILINSQVQGKVFTKCEFLNALKNSKLPENEKNNAGAWLCAANKESKLNSSEKRQTFFRTPATGCLNYTLGIFQITSDTCSDDGHGESCKVNICEPNCNEFLNDDIEDDIKCILKLDEIKGFRATKASWLECSKPQSEKETWESLGCSDELKKSKRNGNSHALPIIITVSVAMIVIAGIIGGVFIWIRRKQNSDKGLSLQEIKDFKYGITPKTLPSGRNSNYSYNSTSQSVVNLLPEDCFDTGSVPYDKKFEIPPSEYDIRMYESIGSGAFGIVFKGTVRGELVAVKSVKHNASKENLKSLLDEVKLMIYLGKNDNIVKIIGASTKFLQRGTVYVFVEYCPLGSLEKFLRSKRENFVNQIVNEDFVPPEDTRYIHQGTSGSPLTSKELISWSYQISNGMKFLASKKVIHGDLATRNVLLSDRNTIKISDFGLSRKFYEYCNYIKTKEEPLPWRWMAIESLRDMTFSTKSDVWAFGVTLWEIFSLGDVPYPGLSWSIDFVDQLNEGLRMRKPRYATVKLYESVMVLAWNNKPDARPTFPQLTSYFHDLLESICSNDYKTLSAE